MPPRDFVTCRRRARENREVRGDFVFFYFYQSRFIDGLFILMPFGAVKLMGQAISEAPLLEKSVSSWGKGTDRQVGLKEYLADIE